MSVIKAKWVSSLVILSLLLTAISAIVPETFCDTPVITASSVQYILGTAVEAGIDENGEVDAYTFEVTETSNVEIYTQGSTDTFGTLMDNSGNVMMEDDDGYAEKNFIIRKLLVPGVYSIEIRDFYSDRVGKYTLQSTVSTVSKDDAGNSMQEAATLPAESASLDFAIDYAGDVDFFKITINKKSLFTANTQLDTDTFGTLYDRSGQILMEDDDGYADKNFKISMTVEPGTYYLSVKDYYPEKWGTYKLTYTLNDLADDFGNAISEASPITFTQPIDAAINYPDDSDYFKLTIEQPGTIEIATQGDTDTFGALLDSNGAELATDDDNGGLKNFKIAKSLTPGIYFIRVKDYYSDRTGAYTLICKFTGDVEDPYGNDIHSAYEIMPDSSVDGFISIGGDTDFFKFKLNEKKTVKIHTTGTTDTFGTLYDPSGNVLLSQDDISNADKNFSITQTLAPGIYYISVRDYYDYYSGSYSMFIQTDNNGTEQTVFVLENGDANTCAFAYGGGRYAYVGCNVSPARIVKFDIQDMKRVSSIDLPAGENRDETRVAALIATGPDTIIHASFTNPCVFTKIDGNTMTITGTLQGKVEDVNDKYIRGLASDGQYVYAATYTTPSKIIKIDPVTMARIDAVTFDDPRLSSCFAITICGGYLVGVCETQNDQGSAIFRISLDDLHQKPEIIQVPGVHQYHSICTDGRYIYAATDTDPIKVVKIDPQATPMRCLAAFTGEQGLEAGNFTIAYDGTGVIAGTWNFAQLPDRLIKLDTNTLTRTDTMDCPSKFPSDLIYIEPYFYTSADHPTGIVNRVKY